MYQPGHHVDIVAGEYAGLGGTIVSVIAPDCYEVLVGGYLLPLAPRDLAPDLRMAARLALTELHRLGGNTQIIALLMAALHT